MLRRAVAITTGLGGLTAAAAASVSNRENHTRNEVSDEVAGSRAPVDSAIIVGGGVVGIGTAYALVKRGVKVTLIEANDTLAGECSTAAAGGMQRSNPRVDRNTWLKTVRSWLSAACRSSGSGEPLSTFHLNFTSALTDPHFWWWFAKFTWASLVTSPSSQDIRQHHLLAFTDWAIDCLLDEMDANGGELADLSHLSRIGALKLIYNEDELSVPPGSTTSKEPVVLLRAQDALELEPSLGALRPPSEKRLRGAALEPASCHASCAAFARGLHRRAAATGLLSTITGVRVSHIGAAEEADTGRKITGLTLDNGRQLDVPTGCAVVVAAGSWTPLLLRQLGLLVPLYPLKGHSLLANLTAEEVSAVPSRIIIEPDSNLFFSRHGQQLRVAAFGQFAGWDTQPDPELVAQLRRASSDVWPALAHHFQHAHAVSGLRPFVADGALLLGRDETYSNLYINAGPGFNGWKISVGSGELLARIMTLDHKGIKALPFDITTFSPFGRVVYSPRAAKLFGPGPLT